MPTSTVISTGFERTWRDTYIPSDVDRYATSIEEIDEHHHHALFHLADKSDWRGVNRTEILLEKKSFEYGHLLMAGLLTKAYQPNLIFKSIYNQINEGQYFAFLTETAENIKTLRKKQFTPTLFPIYYFFHFLFRRVLPKLKGFRKICRLMEVQVDMSKSEVMGRLIYEGFDLVAISETVEDTLFVVKKNKASPPFSASKPPSPEGFLFQMNRLGKDNRPIKVFKMRSMHPYAEYVQEYLYEKHGLENSGKFKDDFRVSTGGRVIRKYWLDELPMILNWLKGDLKLIGVRPISSHYYNLYPEKLKQLRGQHKPGLLPPYYADMPENFEEIVASEINYLESYEQRPFQTDWKYFTEILRNIFIRKARSK